MEPQDLDTAVEELNKTKQAWEKAEAETQAVRTKLHSAVRKGKAIEAERTSLSQQLQELKQQLEKDQATTISNGQLASLEERNSQLTQQLSLLTARLQASETSAGQFGGLQAQLRAALETNKALSRQQQEADNTADIIAELKKENSRLSAQLEAARIAQQEDPEQAQSQIAALQSEHQETVAELQSLCRQRQAETAEALARLEHEHELHLQSLSAKHREELAARGVQLDAERAQILRAVAAGEAETAAAAQRAEKLEAELNSLHQSHAEAEVTAAEQAQSLQERIEALEGQLAEAFSTANASARDNANLKSKLDAVWQRCEELEVEVDRRRAGASSEAGDENTPPRPTLHASNMEAAASAAALNSRVAELESALEGSRAAEEGLKRQMARLQVELLSGNEGAAEEVSRLQKQLQSLTTELDMARQNGNIMREALQSAAAKIQEAQSGEAEARADAERRGEEAAALRRQVAEMEGRLSVQQDLEAELNAALEDLSLARDETGELRLKLQEASFATNAANSRVKELEQQLLDALTGEATKLEEVERLRLDAAEEALRLKDEASAQLAAARVAREAAEAERVAAQEAQAAAQGATAAADARVAAAEAAMEQMQAEEAARKQRFGFLHSTFAKEKAGLQERLTALEEQCTAQMQTIGEQQKALGATEQSVAAARAEVGELENRCRAAEQQAEQLEALLENPETEAAIAKAEKAAAAAMQHAEELEEQLASSRLSCTELTAELEQARQEGVEAASRSERAERQLLAAQEAVAGLKAAKQEPFPLHENGNGNANPIPNGTHDSFLKVQQPTGSLELGPDEDLAVLREELDALQKENASLRGRVDNADKRVAAAGAVQHAKVATLEKQNQELQWQVAMLARDPEAPPLRPSRLQQQQQNSVQEAGGGEMLPKMVGLVLRYRRGLLVAYLVILHVLLYLLLVNRGHAASTCLSGSDAVLQALSEDTKASLKGQ